MASVTRSLTNFYGSFFIGAAQVAVLPYTLTFEAFAGENPKDEDYILGLIACVFLSTVIPILPELFSFTVALALIAANFALISMFIAYPAAILADAVINTANDDFSPAY